MKKCLLNIVFVFVFVFCCEAEERTKYVRASITVNEKDKSYDFINTKLKFSTIAGDLDLWMHEIKDILPCAGIKKEKKRFFLVNTRHGDSWKVEWLNDKLSCYLLDSVKSINIKEMLFSSMSFACKDLAAWQPYEHPKVMLNDGSYAFLDAKDLTIEVKNKMGVNKLPLGAISALRVFPSFKNEKGCKGEVLFPSGKIEDVTISSWFLQGKDTHGNKLKILCKDIKSIAGRQGISLLKSEDTKKFSGLMAVHVASIVGRNYILRIPTVSWRLSSELGDIILPSPLVDKIVRDEKKKNYAVYTVYGDKLSGDIEPSSISVVMSADHGESAEFKIRSQKILKFTDAKNISVPEGWLSLRLHSGDNFFFRFADPYVEMRAVGAKKDFKVLTKNISSFSKRKEEDVWKLVLKNKQVISVKPCSSKVDLVLLSNGMGFDVKWSGIASISEEKQAERTSEPLVKKTSKTDIFGEQFVRVKSSIGEVIVKYSDLLKVCNNKKASVSCYETIFGEVFVGPFISSKTYRMLPGIDSRKDAPSVINFNNTSAEKDYSPKGYLAVRLVSGDMFYAQISNKKELEITEESSRKRSKFKGSSIVSMKKIKDDKYVFNTLKGKVVGKPRFGKISFILRSDVSTKEVSLKSIENLDSVTLSKLPPARYVFPGITSRQEGMVFVEGGSFMMGRATGDGLEDELPEHEVAVSDFYIDACEITKGQFEEFIKDEGYKTSAEKGRLEYVWNKPGFVQEEDEPVTCVSWIDAARFCNWRSRMADLDECYRFKGEEITCNRGGNGYRLSTEAEWEYAARGRGGKSVFPWQADVVKEAESMALFANFKQKQGEVNDNWAWTSPVNYFPPNKIGLYGMGGNVWEWCEDWYYEKAYSTVHRMKSLNPCVERSDVSGLVKKVMRGGSYHNSLDLLRCVSRGNGFPLASADRVGFRCVRSKDPVR